MCVCLLHNQLMFVFVAGSQPASGLLSYKSYAVRVINSGIWYSATLNVAGRVRCQTCSLERSVVYGVVTLV